MPTRTPWRCMEGGLCGLRDRDDGVVYRSVAAQQQRAGAKGGRRLFHRPKGTAKDVGNGLRGAGSESLTVKKDEMSKLKEKLALAIKDSPALQAIKEHVVFTMTNEGLRVEMLEGKDATFFESGSSVPTGQGRICWVHLRRKSANCRIRWRLKGTPTPSLLRGAPTTRTGSFPPIGRARRGDGWLPKDFAATRSSNCAAMPIRLQRQA